MSIDVELRVLNDQVAALRAFLLAASGSYGGDYAAALTDVLEQVEQSRQEREPPTAAIALPDTCEGIEPSNCGKQDDDARISMATFSAPTRWRCRGCRVDFNL